MKRLRLKYVIAIVLLSLSFNGVVFSENADHKQVKHDVAKKKVQDIVFPDWSKLNTFKLKGLEFNKSTEAEFKKLYPFIDDIEEPEVDVNVYTFSPKEKPNYLSVKIAFEDGILSWIDFLPAETITIDQFTKVLGYPFQVNKKISKYLDYYDYGDILVLVDKEKDTVYSFSKYSSENFVSNDAKIVGVQPLPFKSLISGKFGDLIPGVTKESEIKKQYPKLKASVISPEFYPGIELSENESRNQPVIYIINKGLEGTGYDRIEFVVKDRILKWIDIVPKDLSLKDALAIFGTTYKKDEGNERVEFLIYKNLILTSSRSNRKILNIGMLEKVNTKLISSLPKWIDLDKKGISGIEVDKTTLQQFQQLFPSLIAEKSREGNLDIVKVSEGLSRSGYDVIYFIFKNGKLSSIDFVPFEDLEIADLITVYGKDYDLDSKSSDDVDYYSFNNVIVTVDKDNKIVNSIGLY